MKDIELPPLPDSGQNGNQTTDYFGKLFEYTRLDMRSYARAAVEADRAQRVPDGWRIKETERNEIIVQAPNADPGGLTIPPGPGGSLATRLLESLCRALLASTPAPAQQEPSEAEMVCAEAYQVVGCLLSDLGLFETEAARKILDNLSEARMVHQDVLPWESVAQHKEPPQQERKPMTYREIADATSEWAHVRSDYTIGIIRAAERHHGIFAEPAQGIKE